MTTKLLEMFYDAGLTDKDIEKLKRDAQFRSFLQAFSDVDLLSRLIMQYGTENPSVGTSLARRIHAGTIGHDKNFAEYGITDYQLRFSYAVLHALATKHNTELVEEIHGLGKKGVGILDESIAQGFIDHVVHWWASSRT